MGTRRTRAVADKPGTEKAIPEGFQSVDTVNLRIGTALRIPIYDERDVLLIARGATITPSFLQKLTNRGISQVRVHESELSRVYAGQPLGTAQSVPAEHQGHYCQLENDSTRQLDEQIREGGFLGLPMQEEPFEKGLFIHGAESYDASALDQYVETREQAVQQVHDIYHALANGGGLDVDGLSSIADEALSELTGDADLFACLSINPYSDKYPVRHSVHTAMLAISIGTKLGLDRQTLKELAIGCLIHDAGMLKISEDIYNTSKVIDQISFLEITKHPVIVFEMMQKMVQVPSRSAFIAYQIHERCNGSGYPRRRQGNQIHFLSKVAAVADSFIAVVSPRPHRPGMLPYRAMEKIIRGTQEGLYDPSAARALLYAVSLFPIGSYLELSDGRVAKVIRSNGAAYCRPVVEAWHPAALQLPPDMVNLLEHEELQIVRPLAQLKSAAELAHAGASKAEGAGR